MRFLTLACDYDGTLASDGTVAPSTLGALERLRASGRRLILVTRPAARSGNAAGGSFW
jgi:hydroxymethylpyrimidine pyrophosphatase-like HAD family hydrolase